VNITHDVILNNVILYSILLSIIMHNILVLFYIKYIIPNIIN